MCKVMNIIVKVNAAESPFNNRLFERHNFIIADILDKILEPLSLNPDLALSWCLNAKNAITNVNEFSPF